MLFLFKDTMVVCVDGMPFKALSPEIARKKVEQHRFWFLGDTHFAEYYDNYSIYDIITHSVLIIN